MPALDPLELSYADHSTWWRQRKFLNLLLVVAIFLSPFANLTAAVAEDAAAPSLKRKVAIARFSNETKADTSFFVGKSGDKLGKQAADILGARLALTQKFLMFERQDLDEVSAEQVVAGLKAKGVAVDYLIVGSVSEFGRSTESQSGVFQRAKTQRAYAKVNVRIVEVPTGRIVHAAEGAGEASSQTKRTLGVGSSAGFDQSLDDKAISEAISQLVSVLVEKMTDNPWRSYLVAREGDFYLMPGGSRQGIQPGTTLYAYRKGKSITNPLTGGVLELPGSRIGTLVVHSVHGEDEFSELAFLTVTEGSISESLDQYYLSDK